MTENRVGLRADGRQALATTGIWVSNDPSVHEQAVKPWELLTSLPSAGPFRHEMRYLSASTFTVYEERFACGVHLRGQLPPDVIAVAVPIQVLPNTICWKAPWSTEQLPSISNDALDVLLEAGQHHLIVLVACALVQRELGEERAQGFERLCRFRRLPSTELRVAQLRAFLLELLDAVDASPRVLSDPVAVRSIEADLIRNVAAAVSMPVGYPASRGSPPDRTGLSRLLARVLDYVRATDPVDLTIPQLCEAAGVRQRSLEHAFRETFDLTPLGFLRLRRLHSARCRLIAADPADMAVADIAYQEGFYHLGRFAAAYMSAFGERPSQTLRRPCPGGLRRLMAVRPLMIAEQSQQLAGTA